MSLSKSLRPVRPMWNGHALCLLFLALLLVIRQSSAKISKIEAYGHPCAFETDLQSTWEEENVICPPRFYCFWDKKPFNVSADGVVTEIPEADYPVDPSGKYKSAFPDKQMYGYCDCNKFYGFAEPEDGCSDTTAGTWFFNVWAKLLVLQCITFLGVIFYTIYGFSKSKQFKNNASCQTLILSIVCIVMFALFELGYIFTMNDWDKDWVFHKTLLSYGFTLSFASWLVTALNIAIAWIEVVEKSQKKGQKGNIKLYKRVIYSAMSVLTLGIFFTLVVLGSPQLAGAVVFLALIFIAVVFYFGGKKLGNMLRNGKAKQAGGEMTMERMVEDTANRVSKGALATLILVILFIMFTNNNIWLSTPGIQGGLQSMFILTVLVIRFIRFGGRRGMAKEGLTPIFRCEAAKQGKLDARRSSTTSSVAPEETPSVRDVDGGP